MLGSNIVKTGPGGRSPHGPSGPGRTAARGSRQHIAAPVNADGNAGHRQRRERGDASAFGYKTLRSVHVHARRAANSVGEARTANPEAIPMEEEGEQPKSRRRSVVNAALGAAAAGIIAAGVSAFDQPAQAAEVSAQEESKEVVECLFQKCRNELFGCLANTACAANLVCLSQCTGKPDEIACQIRCGDLFQTAAIDKFNDCAITRGKCVPQRPDESLYPIPEPTSLVQDFDMTKFTGDWYITMGQNKLFDTFDCQLHKFSYDETKKMLVGDLQWRVGTPDGGFITRSAEQTFRQDQNQPSLLINDGNEFLHYSDNWYIASAQLEGKDTDHVFVYYRGINDAWDGYGGAVLYTKQPTVPQSLEPTIKTACERLPNIKFSELAKTNNQCGKEAPLIERIEKLEKTTEKAIEDEGKVLVGALEREEEQIFEGIEERVLQIEGEVYKDANINARIGQEVVNDLAFLIKGFERDVIGAEKELEGYARKLGMAIVSGEKEFVKTESSLFKRFFNFITRNEEKVLNELEMDVKDVEDLLGKTFGNGATSFIGKRSSRVTATIASAK